MVWVLTALGITIIAFVFEGYILRDFYRYAESFAPGTEINGIGFAFCLGEICIASTLIGGACALVGGILSLRQRRWQLVAFAAIAFVVAWIPWFVGTWGIRYIMSLRQLIPHQ